MRAWEEYHSHTRQEWEHIRPILTEVYLRPGVRLDDAIAIVASQYGFHATKMMFKKRLHGWGVRKNLKSVDKDHILDQALLEQQEHHVRRKVQRYAREREKQNHLREVETATPDEDGFSTTVFPARQQQRNEDLGDNEGSGNEDYMSWSSASATAIATPTSMNTPVGSVVSPSLTSPEDLRDEQLLVQSLKECLLSMKSGHEACPFSASYATEVTPLSFWREHFAQEMFFSFYVGEEALALGLFGNATSHFRIAGRHLVRCLERPSHQVMIDLLDIIRVFSWVPYESYKAAIYRFLATIVKDTLGPQHPFSIVIALLVQHAEDPEWQSATWETLIQQDSRKGCDCIRLQAQSNYGLALEHHCRLEHSIEINERLLGQELSVLGPAHEASRRTMFRLGRLYYKTKDSRKAINGLQNALRLIKQQPSASPYDSIHLLIYGELARSHEDLGNDGAALNWYWTAFRESAALFGNMYEDSLWYLHELVDFLQRHSKPEEFQRVSEQMIDLEQIKQEYSQSYGLLNLGFENLKLDHREPPRWQQLSSVAVYHWPVE